MIVVLGMVEARATAAAVTADVCAWVITGVCACVAAAVGDTVTPGTVAASVGAGEAAAVCACVSAAVGADVPVIGRTKGEVGDTVLVGATVASAVVGAAVTAAAVTAAAVTMTVFVAVTATVG